MIGNAYGACFLYDNCMIAMQNKLESHPDEQRFHDALHPIYEKIENRSTEITVDKALTVLSDLIQSHSVEELRIRIEKTQPSIEASPADKCILHKCYSDEKLQIRQLSGYPLPINECCINLEIVHRAIDLNNAQASLNTRSNTGSSTGETNRPVTLPALFDEHRFEDERAIQQKRIMIHGRAGVGKIYPKEL
ncbi:hypothetical protein J3458_001637 [Metarhizium acridum]|uniref:uncharacterized protein n=1 Tax=Metarhizium acridum TaxID=92637 RepID=UPI001C6BF003|nr:hypothetical protein J3458_001637 [Metarhizium acridum]